MLPAARISTSPAERQSGWSRVLAGAVLGVVEGPCPGVGHEFRSLFDRVADGVDSGGVAAPAVLMVARACDAWSSLRIFTLISCWPRIPR